MSIAHIGDSRVYHIRGEHILFCTEDHSLVVELKKQGLLAESERASRNVITRAIQGDTIKPTKADVYLSDDLQTGDYFLLCTDGVWDCLPNKDLLQLLAQESSDETKVEIIRQRCAEKSNDNYSLILVRICCSREDPSVTGKEHLRPVEEHWGTHTGVKVESTSKTPASTLSNETAHSLSAWRLPRWLAQLLTR